MVRLQEESSPIFDLEVASSQEHSKLSEEERKDLRVGAKTKDLFAV